MTTVTSIVTADSALFDATEKFYTKDLGFTLNREWTTRDSSGGGVSRAVDSLREDTLVLDLSSLADSGANNMIAIYLRESPGGLPAEESSRRVQQLIAEVDKHDWRDIMPAIVFSVPVLTQKIIEYTKKTPIKQQYPEFGDPIEVYVVDPLGNLVGFTCSGAPVSTKIVVPKLEAPKTTDKLGSLTIAPGSDLERTPLPGQLVASYAGKALKDPVKRIGVLTSGGDSPGMNAAVRAVVRHGIYRGCEVYAIYEGYEGLVQGGKYIKPMSWDDVRGYLSIGGTLIGTARCAAFRERAGRLQGCLNMVKNGIDALVVIGGDGSLTGADYLRQEWPGLVEELASLGKITPAELEKHRHLYIAGLVGSIDNDMALTDVTIGSFSSLDRIATNIDWIQATAESHQRAFVIEVMGRHCGWLALMAAIASRADYVFLPEMPPNAGEWAQKMNRVVLRHREAGARRTIVIVAEGAIDSDLNQIKSEDVKHALEKIGLDTRVTTFGHIQRGGTAVALDRLLATMQGAEAVEAILEATPETPSPMIGTKENKICRVNLMDAVRETKKVAEAIARKDFVAARSLRDAEFNEHLRNYLAISQSDKIRPGSGLKVAIVACGAPAGGMNAAIAAAASFCLSQGHQPFAVHNSWAGLARHEAIIPLSWLDISNMYAKGGCDIGTNRGLPDVDLGMIAFYLARHEIQGLIVVGGFEAFKSLEILESSRAMYPAFRIPMTLVPATISNNVPGTESSLGTDTCLNALVNYCDVVKQSASSTRNRVFIVEVQGGQSGFIAAYAALVTGAYAVYVPEDGISLTQMSADIKHLRECFKRDQGRERAGRLVIRNELASPGFSTANLTAIFETESHGRFDAREAIPGHLQQGGLPSPLDHVRATRLGIRCVQFIEENQKVDWSDTSETAHTAVVIGVEASRVKFTPVRYLWETETEVKLRRSTKVHWGPVLQMANTMALRPTVSQEPALE